MAVWRVGRDDRGVGSLSRFHRQLSFSQQREMGVELPGGGIDGLVHLGYVALGLLSRLLQCHFQHRLADTGRAAASRHEK